MKCNGITPKKGRGMRSSPSRGMRVEILLPSLYASPHLSSPSRGMRVEMELSEGFDRTAKSSPSRGMRVEIRSFFLASFRDVRASSPSRGMRVEITSMYKCQDCGACRPPRGGCELKYLLGV